MADFYINKLIVKGAVKRMLLQSLTEGLRLYRVLQTQEKTPSFVVSIIFLAVIIFRLRVPRVMILLCFLSAQKMARFNLHANWNQTKSM